MRLLLTLLASLLPFVNPFIGTGGHGHTFPGATFPFGMMQLSPDTRHDPSSWDGASGYHYSDSLIYGFTHTHLSGTGATDWCDLLIMPVTGMKDSVDRNEYASPFSHKREHASPGYYEVFLEKPQVLAKMTVGKRAGIHQYTFPEDVAPMLVIDLNHRDRLLESSLIMDKNNPYVIYGVRKSSIWARKQDLYFYVEFSKPVICSKIDSTGAILHFKHSKTNVLNVRVGISSVSCGNAKLNLMEENIVSFNGLREYTENEWENFLSTINCPFEDDKRRTIFYTALYHCGIHPSLYGDIDGSYGSNGIVWNSPNFDRYTVFSLWDTFRGLHPLLRELSPELTSEFILSMLAIFREQGKLPVWELSGYETNCMTGYHSAPVIADALLHDVHGIPLAGTLGALITSSNVDEFGMDSFRKNGCVLGDDESQCVTRTLEYAYDDWCVAQVAKHIIGVTEDTDLQKRCSAVYDQYMISAQYWRNVFDPETGMMRARYNGRWAEPFDPDDVSCHYTEGIPRQYAFFVPHDLLGLMRAMGGPTKFCARLDSLFCITPNSEIPDMSGMIGGYAHGNEPSMHIPYLYALAGQPEKTRAIVDTIMTRLYSNSADGLCGNDDCGQMSAWYILSALGKYPVCPGNIGQEKTWIPKTIVVNPVFEMDSDLMEDSLVVRIANIDAGARAFYKIGTDDFKPYTGPFTIYKPDTLRCYSENLSGKKSFTVQSVIRKKTSGISITAGAEILIDGRRGSANWQAGDWLKIEEKDFQAILDLKTLKEVHEIGVGLCHDTRARIWLPEYVRFLVSNDGINWAVLSKQDFNVDSHENKAYAMEALIKSSKGFYTRYIKVELKNRGKIPPWHYAAGYPAWIYLDEIRVD